MQLYLPPDTIHPDIDHRYEFQGLRFEALNYPSDLHLPKHSHRQMFLDFCLTGAIQEHWGKATFQRGPCTLTVLPVGTLHSSQFQEGTRSFQIVLDTLWLERIRQVTTLSETPVCYQNSLPAWIAMRMYREFQQQDNVTPLALEGLLLELIAAMTRYSASPAESHAPRWLKEAREYLHAHFNEPITMETIAAAVGVHPSHLMRGFRQHERCTIGDYVRKLRIEYACHLLANARVSPAEAALTVGFADQSHFSRTFKGCTGLTPGEFQKISGSASHRQ